jgi:hypothetical protein
MILHALFGLLLLLALSIPIAATLGLLGCRRASPSSR